MGKFVVSGSGKGHSASVFWFVYYIGMAVISFVLANTIGFFAIFVMLGIVEIALGALTAKAISNTEIEVYEDRIEGIGLSKWFYFGDTRTFNFLFSVNQVSVSVNGSQLLVRDGSGNEYKVYVNNGEEIQGEIFKLAKKTS